MKKHEAKCSLLIARHLLVSSSSQWWATVTFKVTTLPLPLLKEKREKLPLQLLQKRIIVSNFALQTTTTFVKKVQ